MGRLYKDHREAGRAPTTEVRAHEVRVGTFCQWLSRFTLDNFCQSLSPKAHALLWDVWQHVLPCGFCVYGEIILGQDGLTVFFARSDEERYCGTTVVLSGAGRPDHRRSIVRYRFPCRNDRHAIAVETRLPHY